MTLDAFSQLLDRCAASAQALSRAVGASDTESMRNATLALSTQILDMQRALPQVSPQLVACSAPVRAGWSERIEAANYLFKMGAELSALNTADAAARLAVLARASGADMNYASSGQLAR